VEVIQKFKINFDIGGVLVNSLALANSQPIYKHIAGKDAPYRIDPETHRLTKGSIGEPLAKHYQTHPAGLASESDATESVSVHMKILGLTFDPNSILQHAVKKNDYKSSSDDLAIDLSVLIGRQAQDCNRSLNDLVIDQTTTNDAIAILGSPLVVQQQNLTTEQLNENLTTLKEIGVSEASLQMLARRKEHSEKWIYKLTMTKPIQIICSSSSKIEAREVLLMLRFDSNGLLLEKMPIIVLSNKGKLESIHR
jgi:hypothetical protein